VSERKKLFDHAPAVLKLSMCITSDSPDNPDMNVLISHDLSRINGYCLPLEYVYVGLSTPSY